MIFEKKNIAITRKSGSIKPANKPLKLSVLLRVDGFGSRVVESVTNWINGDFGAVKTDIFSVKNRKNRKKFANEPKKIGNFNTSTTVGRQISEKRGVSVYSNRHIFSILYLLYMYRQSLEQEAKVY
jgi:hypothetical protein